MATKKNNKTEHVLKLITKNHDEQDENWDDTPAEEELMEDVMIEEIIPEVQDTEENGLELQADKAPDQEPDAKIEPKTELEKKAPEESTKLINLAQMLAVELLPEVIKRMKICQCDACKNDILALALNSLPQKYVTTDTGKQYTMLEIYRGQYETDVIAALTRACVRVKGTPRHQ